ncbi:Protein prune like 2 [Dissostichus eleginoides]|uniref:Protein prune like 2 n=1 Tax=Dissostichus eleginoides TaxID=100907 RepID=A0AAD9F553_DISEL|nr:Protein prune like 2 [Dissostichus eleginoides]
MPQSFKPTQKSRPTFPTQVETYCRNLVYGEICSDAVATQTEMDEYLRRVQSRLGSDASEDTIHAVLGGPEPDVDTVAATLCIALHLSQKETSGRLCVPVLCRPHCDAALPEETVRYLRRVKISQSSLVWREDVDLVKLHHTGKLSLTLLRDGLLDSSEYHTLESSILRVVHHGGQQDAGDDRASSAVSTVAGEILQEASEHIGAALGETLGEALQLQSEALWIKHGHRSAQLEELMRSWEQWSDVTAAQHDVAKLQDLEHLLTLELKEFSDGEMTIALTSVTTDKEDWHGYVDGLESFSHRHGYDALVGLLSTNDTVHHPRQQVAVYSNNTNLLNQICCELEESSSWSLSGEMEARGGLQGLCRSAELCIACHPSSRTSSTEGVAGSVEFSQGSSGINDMDGSDIERTEGGSGDVVPIARVMTDGEEVTGGVGAGAGAGGELMSPDSGMTTIRSSRSSKESSVFLINSVVGSRPPSSCGVRFFPEDVVERINGLQHKDSVSSSLSETWDELGFETQGAMSLSDSNAWNRTKGSESPLNIIEEDRGKESLDDMTEQNSKEEILKSENAQQRGKNLEPQLSLITEQTESYDTWNPESVGHDKWNPITLHSLQLTPPEEESIGKCRAGIIGVKEKTSSLLRKKATLNTLTPDTSKEDDEGVQGKKGDRQMELPDFWTYSAQKGFLKSDSGTTTSYPESLDLWNMTIRDDSISPLTTPDNLSGNSGSFCGVIPNVKTGASVESPEGFPDGGMVMWNTTIQEDSSSTVTSPEGPENGKNRSHMGSLDTSDSPEIHVNKQVEQETAKGEEREYETTPHQGTDIWDLPVPGMVTSTSEYENVGAGPWSLPSSPEAHSSPVVDMIQLEEQSSPFIAVTRPNQIEGPNQKADPLGNTESRADISDKEQTTNQVFLFEGASELGHMISSEVSSNESNEDQTTSKEADWIEQHSDHSPFVLVDYSTVSDHFT